MSHMHKCADSWQHTNTETRMIMYTETVVKPDLQFWQTTYQQMIFSFGDFPFFQKVVFVRKNIFFEKCIFFKKNQFFRKKNDSFKEKRKSNVIELIQTRTVVFYTKRNTTFNKQIYIYIKFLELVIISCVIKLYHSMEKRSCMRFLKFLIFFWFFFEIKPLMTYIFNVVRM